MSAPRITGYAPAAAGSTRKINEVVVGFFDHGIPDVGFTGEFAGSHGNRLAQVDWGAAFCEALGPNHH